MRAKRTTETGPRGSGTLVALFVAVAALSAVGCGRRPPEAAGGAARALRSMFLELSAEQAGVTVPETPGGIWGAALDMSFPNGSATLATTIDGAASLYFSTGGGVLGGEAHAAVRAAAEGFVAAMEQCAPQLGEGAPRELPAAGMVRFYAHSKSGLLLSSEVREADLAAAGHPLHSCYEAAQDVITELRLVSDS